jgi:hypothetical protein
MLNHRKGKHGLEGDGASSQHACNEQTKKRNFSFQMRIGVLLMAGFLMTSSLLGGTPSDSRLQERMNNPPQEQEEKVPEEAPNTRGGRRRIVQEEKELPPIHGQTLKVIAPDHPTWTDEDVHTEFQNALQKIKDAPIVHEPFDHFFVKDLFSAKFYQALMNELPPPSTYQSAIYPGTDPVYRAYHLASDLQNRSHVHMPEQCFKKRSGEHRNPEILQKRRKAGCWLEDVQLHSPQATHGRTLTVNQDASAYPLWVQTFRLVHSRNFTHLMYSKFATDTGIPEYKQKEVARQAEGDTEVGNLRNTAALRIEPTSYHLTPHLDRYEKLVTWQFFHPESRELENRTVGTQFYELKKEYQNTVEVNDVKNPQWIDYSFFNSIKHQPVIPNYFFSFAPNHRSWHGAAIDPEKMKGANPHARRTFLGFLTTKNWGYHHFNNDDWAPEEFDFTATA